MRDSSASEMVLAVFRLFVEKTAHLVTSAARLSSRAGIALADGEEPAGRYGDKPSM